MQTRAYIHIDIVNLDGWKGDVVIRPVVYSETQLGQPGKKVGDTLLVEAAEGSRRLLVSLGLKEKLNPEAVRQAGGAAVKWLADHQVHSAGIQLQDLDHLGVDGAVEAFCQGLILGAYRFNRHKTASEDEFTVTTSLLVGEDSSGVQASLERAQAVASSVNLARELAHEPPNVINPVTLAEWAHQTAELNGLSYKLLDEAQLKELGAGAILAVGQGSRTPSQMIILEYPGQPGQQDAAPVVVVGKAITFDTGGYSLKDRTGMVGMKNDKCGGAAVLGILQAAAKLKLAVPVIGIIAAAENMVSSDAYRPNDIITSLSGKTIEIISTDAEGRLVLADALTFAHTRYQPRAVIDLATLTGGIVVALGQVRAGVMANDDALAEALMAAGERTYERLWRMPLDEDYVELIRGDDSDLVNSSSHRGAHPIVGGIFLRQFVPDSVPWAHLDIAGTATTDKNLPYCPKGATGFGVRLVADYLSNLE